MAVYKFTYFDFIGLGESIRYLLHYGGVQYENVIIKHKTNWPTVKSNYPFGKLPVLEVDGKMLYNCPAIMRYLARKFNLLTGDDWTNSQIDAISETIYDLYYRVVEWHREVDATRKAHLYKILDTKIFPLYYSRMEKIVESNSGYFGGKLTWVDFFFVGIMESIEGMWGTRFFENKYHHLYTLTQRVYGLPAIKSYISKRRSYEYKY